MELPRFKIYLFLKITIIIIILLIIFIIKEITFVGLYDLPPDFKVDAEYINGILTASSILFGFWVILIQTRPKKRVQKWKYDNILVWNFGASVVSLILSVVTMFLGALNKISSVITLSVCMVSFFANTFYLSVDLY